MDKLYLIATIAGQPVAIRASAIESVVDIGEVTPVPRAPVHVAGVAALRSRLLTIICSERALGLPNPARRATRGVVVSVEGHLYGILVCGIDDVCLIEQAPRPVRSRLDAGWSAVALGMLDFGEETLLLVDPARLIAGSQAAAA